MHSFLKKGKTKSRYTDTKNRRELCSRFKMMFYVTALKFKDGTVVAPIHSLTVPKRIEWWVTVFSLSIPPALGGFATSQSYIVFSCTSSFKGIILYHKTRRKSRNLRRVLNIFRILGNTNNFYSILSNSATFPTIVSTPYLSKYSMGESHPCRRMSSQNIPLLLQY